MIIILEGANGVGKTTYAEALEKALGIKRFRPWSQLKAEGRKLNNIQEHPAVVRLTSMRVEVNSHIEDMYAANFLAETGLGAIVDKSIPSAIAYDALGNIELAPSAVLKAWQELLLDIKPTPLYVWLVSPHEVAKERVADRWMPTKAQHVKLVNKFKALFDAIKLQKMRIDTSQVEVKDGVRRIVKAVR